MTTADRDPSDWKTVIAAHPPRLLDPGALGRTIVVAAHPDDETLAVGGLMRAIHEAGGQVELVLATDGEAAFPDLDATGRAELRRVRARELDAALAAHGLADIPVHRLRMPDSALDADALAAALVPLLRDAETYLAPWSGDPHPDHAAAGRAAAAAAPVTCHGWGYPIWMWVHSAPDDPSIPWSYAFGVELDADARAAKRRAVSCFASQLGPGPGGEPPVVPPGVRAHFDTGREIVFRIPRPDGAPRSRFDELYAGGDGDPWETRTSWYERRKRAVLLACLPAERYRHAAEPACGTGALTVELAARCDRLDASDFSPSAVEQTATATAGLGHVEVTRLVLPDEATLPAGIDLAVLSEVLYYLSDADLARTADRLADALDLGGDVVLVHWDGWPAEAPRDAAAAHQVLIDHPRFELLAEHVDEEFLLHVLRRW